MHCVKSATARNFILGYAVMNKFIKNGFLQAILILTLFFTNTVFGQKTVSQINSCNDCVPNEVIFELANQSNLPAVAAQYGLNPTPIGQAGVPITYLMQITGNQTPEQIVTAMRSDARIAKPEVNRKLSVVEREGLPWTIGVSWTIGRTVKGYQRQWFPYRIRLNEAHNLQNGGSRGAGVTVAILDTGIDLTHPAFAGKLVPGYDFVDNDNDPSEVGVLRQGSFGHGTHVAGIVALTAPDAKIMPIRILDSNGEGELWRVTQAIIWAANNGADIINISFGYPQNVEVLKDLLDACDDGLTVDGKIFPEIGANRLAVVAGAGNGGNNLPIYPAAERLDGELGVGSSTRYDLLSNFSTFNRDWIRVIAPGENIVSALPDGRYGVWSGTSMSAPIVSGVAALVKAKFPALTPDEVLNRVKETGVRIDYNTSPRGRIQSSRVDALCAVMNNQNCLLPQLLKPNAGFEEFGLK